MARSNLHENILPSISEVEAWTNSDVMDWIAEFLQTREYDTSIKISELQGESLLEMTADLWRNEIKIQSLHARLKLQKWIRLVREGPEQSRRMEMAQVFSSDSTSLVAKSRALLDVAEKCNASFRKDRVQQRFAIEYAANLDAMPSPEKITRKSWLLKYHKPQHAVYLRNQSTWQRWCNMLRDKVLYVNLGQNSEVSNMITEFIKNHFAEILPYEFSGFKFYHYVEDLKEKINHWRYEQRKARSKSNTTQSNATKSPSKSLSKSVELDEDDEEGFGDSQEESLRENMPPRPLLCHQSFQQEQLREASSSRWQKQPHLSKMNTMQQQQFQNPTTNPQQLGSSMTNTQRLFHPFTNKEQKLQSIPHHQSQSRQQEQHRQLHELLEEADEHENENEPNNDTRKHSLRASPSVDYQSLAGVKKTAKKAKAKFKGPIVAQAVQMRLLEVFKF